MRSLFSQKKEALWIAVFLLIAFFGTGILLRHQGMYVSPDETANAFFAETFATTGHVFSFDSLSATFDDLIHPRSILSEDGRLVPAGFLGLPVLYGWVIKILGSAWLIWLTPFIALLAVLAWYFIVRKCFDQTVAFYAALLLALHPAWWYYSARSLMPNVLCVSLLIFAFLFLIVRPWREKIAPHLPISRFSFFSTPFFDFFFAGIFLGLCFFVRPSEFFWIAGVLGLLALSFRHAWKWKDLAALLFGWILCGLVPLLLFQYWTYGLWFATGYTLGETTTSAFEITSVSLSAWERFSTTPPVTWIFPFGMHLWSVIVHVWQYGLQLFWWLTVLGLGGFVLLFFPRQHRSPERRQRYSTYGLLFLFVGSWLALLYGSWTFYDNPDPTQITIANSYVRYWLPIFVLSTPLIALFIDWFARHANTGWLKKATVVFFLTACVLLNTYTVFFRGDDGLFRVASTWKEDAQVREYVLGITDTEAVIVVDRADKIFFPYRHVVYPLRSDVTYDLLPRLNLHSSVYYYGITLPEEDIEYLNTIKLKERGLQIELVETFYEESLYHFYSL